MKRWFFWTFVFFIPAAGIFWWATRGHFQPHKMHQRDHVLRWAADPSSGAPYVYPNPKDPTQIIGFEVDLVDALARELGREPVFVANQWDGLIPGLINGMYDVVVNGICIQPDRQQTVSFTIPYYWSHGQLVVRENETRIHHLDDCTGCILGVRKDLKGVAALQSIEGVTLRYYDNEFNAFEDLLSRRIDAVFFDAPEVLYFTRTIPGLRCVGKPVGSLLYGMALRPQDTGLMEELNEGIKRLQSNGTLAAILERWGLLNERMALLLGYEDPFHLPPNAQMDYLKSTQGPLTAKELLVRYLSFCPLLLDAALMTLQVSLLAMLVAIGLGLFLALLRLYAPRPFSGMATCFIEVIRGMPLLIQLYFIFYGLPSLGIRLSPLTAGVISLGVNYGAYEAENYRAGISAVPRAQMEAARALGMSHIQSLRYVILPQAFRLVIPPVTNDFISLIKDSSLVSVITIVELTQMYTQLASAYYDYFGIGVLVGVFYLLLGVPFVWLARKAEHRLSAHRHRGRHEARDHYGKGIV